MSDNSLLFIHVFFTESIFASCSMVCTLRAQGSIKPLDMIPHPVIQPPPLGTVIFWSFYTNQKFICLGELTLPPLIQKGILLLMNHTASPPTHSIWCQSTCWPFLFSVSYQLYMEGFPGMATLYALSSASVQILFTSTRKGKSCEIARNIIESYFWWLSLVLFFLALFRYLKLISHSFINVIPSGLSDSQTKIFCYEARI